MDLKCEKTNFKAAIRPMENNFGILKQRVGIIGVPAPETFDQNNLKILKKKFTKQTKMV